jgi:cholesterol transport system auxiliary component
MKHWGRRGVLGAALAAGGCSLLPQRPYQERREWPLDVARPVIVPANPNGPVLLMRALRGGPGLDDRGLRSLQASGAEHVDYWEEWAVPPPQGVEASLRQWLAASGKFAAVVSPGTQLAPQWVLEGELLALVADLPRHQAKATISCVLLRAGTHAVPVLQRSFTGTAPLTAEDGPALAQAMRQAMAACFTQIEAALSEAA